jgi:hypothetical protein
MTKPCYRSVAPGATIPVTAQIVSDETSLTTRTFASGVQVHQAWHVSWAASDTNTLSPSLPDLTSSMLVPTWVPGQSIPPGAYDRASKNDETALNGLGQVTLFLEIGIPLIAIALIAGCGWCCWARKRSRRRKIAGPRSVPNAVAG